MRAAKAIVSLVLLVSLLPIGPSLTCGTSALLNQQAAARSASHAGPGSAAMQGPTAAKNDEEPDVGFTVRWLDPLWPQPALWNQAVVGDVLTLRLELTNNGAFGLVGPIEAIVAFPAACLEIADKSLGATVVVSGGDTTVGWVRDEELPAGGVWTTALTLRAMSPCQFGIQSEAVLRHYDLGVAVGALVFVVGGGRIYLPNVAMGGPQ